MPQSVLDTYRRNANANQSILKAERLRAEYEAILKEQRERQERIKWGPEYTGMKDKEAIKFLLEKKGGWVHILNFGYVSLVYGEAGNPQNEYKPGYGLAHIIGKHGMAAVDVIPKALKNGTITPSTKENNKFDIVYDNYKIVIKSEWAGNKINWLVTSFEQNDIAEDAKNSPRVAKIPVVDDLTRETQSSPDVDYKKSLSQTTAPHNTHAEITGLTLQQRGEGWGSEQWSNKDYSVERDYATATGAAPTVQNEADKKLALTRISDIMNKLRKIRPVRQGVDAPKSVLGHIVDYKLGLRDRVANSAQLAAMQQELEALGVNTSPPNSTAEYLRKPSSAERYPIIHVRRMARA